MPLPDLIEIVPPARVPPRIQLAVPGSKSVTNRALILAALANGKTTLHGALRSDDTDAVVESLRRLGFDVAVSDDPDDDSNCTVDVAGHGGEIPRAGTHAEPLELDVAAAGTAARFLLALVCLGRGTYRLSGTARMNQRPQAPLIDALRALGYRIDTDNGRLPALVHGEGPKPGECDVAIDESSQFASALLLASRAGSWRVRVLGEDAEESAYVAMTMRLMDVFPHNGGDFFIEPDASSASYFLAAGALLGSEVEIAGWPESGWQIDARFRDLCRRFADDRSWPSQISRLTDLGDAIMTAIVMAPFLDRPVRFTDLGRLRLQESERVTALRTELTKCGARVIEDGDTLEVHPSKLNGAEIDTYDDHRMAMCFAALGLKVPGMRIREPGCVSKTFPGFYQKLVAPPPYGFGAAIVDASSGVELDSDSLLA